jgi:hypothetical protein
MIGNQTQALYDQRRKGKNVPRRGELSPSLAPWKEGGDYISVEGQSMIRGSIALALYSLVVCQLLMRLRWSALAATTTSIFLWQSRWYEHASASCSVDWRQLWPKA